MGEAAFQHVGEDLHVLVRVGRESAPGRDDVVIDDPQRAESHVGRVVIIGEGKRETALQPAVVGETPLVGAADAGCLYCVHVMR